MPKLMIDEFVKMKKQAEDKVCEIIQDLYEETGYYVDNICISKQMIGAKKLFMEIEFSGKFFPRS